MTTGDRRDDPPRYQPDREKDLPTVKVLAEQAEAVRRQAVGAQTAGSALGSGADVGSGTSPDRSELGSGEPKAEEGTSVPAGARSPGAGTRE